MTTVLLKCDGSLGPVGLLELLGSLGLLESLGSLGPLGSLGSLGLQDHLDY